MSQQTMETLARRLDRVERENRRLKSAGAVALAVIAAIVVMGQAMRNNIVKAKLVEAEKLVVRDTSGNVRGELATFPEGGVGLTLHDSDGRLLASLGAADDAAILGLFAKNQTGQVRLIVKPDGSSGLSLFDRVGKVRAVLAISSDSPSLILGDAEKPVIMLDGGTRSLNFFRGGGSLAFFDKQGKKRIFQGTGNDGSPHLVLLDRNEIMRTAVGTTELEVTHTGEVTKRPPSSLVLFDKAGKVIWSAP